MIGGVHREQRRAGVLSSIPLPAESGLRGATKHGKQMASINAAISHWDSCSRLPPLATSLRCGSRQVEIMVTGTERG